MKKKPAPPRANLMDPGFKYVPATSTDVTQTWRKYGWKPLAEKQTQRKEESLA